MGIWAWVQPVDRIWKVVSDPEKGTISVFNEQGKLISEQRDLSKEAVALLEKEFLGIVATRLTQADARHTELPTKSQKKYDPMYG